MILPITMTIAGAAAILNAWLGVRCSLRRRGAGISLGDGGDAIMAARMRAHANFIEYTPIILILTPVLLPVARQAGINEIYFGVIFVVCGSIGLITPPVGTVLNVVAGATKSNMTQVVKGVAPFLLSHLVILTLLILFPALVIVPAKWFGS